MKTIRSSVTLFVMVALATAGKSNAENTIRLQRDGDVVQVTIDDKLFTRYLAQPDADPILWPLIGPTGVEMTRGYPMREGQPGEKTDHPHHRSMWFSHGDVDGVDFWAEPGENNRKKRGFGRIVHREFMRIDEAGDAPLIMTRNEWVNSKDEPLMTDIRTIKFGSSGGARWIDFDIQLFAAGEKPVKIGDTKEGTFGVRVPHWMITDEGGRIINNLGKTDKEAWGVAASWVDYHGDHEGKKLGVAILNHPASFRFPTYWHVRTYGLFAANVFGLHNFKNSDEVDGSYELQPGESLLFCYRVLLHGGNEQEGRVPEAFIQYAKLDKIKLTMEELEAKAQVESNPSPDTDAAATEAVETP